MTCLFSGNQKPSMKSLGLATVGSVGFARPVKPKMDLNRALRIMGYTSSKEVSKQNYLGYYSSFRNMLV